MELSENALEVLKKRYLIRDTDRNVIETPKEMFRRVAITISKCEKDEHNRDLWYHKFVEIMDRLEFLPNSPTLRNAGANKGSFSACFVVPIEDSRKSIFKALQHSVEIQAFGGGTGHNFSKLRPEDSLISTTKGKSSGPIGFMKVFDFVIGEVIQQGGCFTGSTLVATAEGPKPIKDLKQDDLVYSWDGRFILAKCTNPWLTKKNAEVWKLSTDKGLIIYATPDHPFLVRYSNGKNKKYVQLKDLMVGTPLMPLTRYKKGNEWFITLHDGKDTRMTEHQWMAEFLDIAGHIHHKDGKHDNNIPSNLEGMTHSEHNTYHGKKRYQEGDHPFLFLTEEQKTKAVNSRKDWFYGLSEEELLQYREKVSMGVEGVNQQRIESGTHNFITNPPMRNEVSKIKKLKNCIANSMWKVMEKGLSVNIQDWEENAKKAGLYNTQRFSVNKIEEIFGSFDSALEYLDNRNQKVLSVEFSHHEDVWNVEVPGPHNFVVCDENRKGVVVSNTRHGAQMGILNIDHQDIEKFITCKQIEGQLSNFNISVAITDHFMKCMNDFGDDFRFAKWPLFFGSKWKEISGYDLWNKIVEGAWKNGEPGIIFIDTINKQSPTFGYQTIESTNPCWTGDTKVWTINGPKSFKDLSISGEDVPVLSQDTTGKLVFQVMRKPHCTWKRADLVKLTLDDGSVLRLTKAHQLYLKNGTKIAVSKLNPGDSLASVYRYRANQKGYLRLTNGKDMPLEHHAVVSFKYGRRPDYPTEHAHHKDDCKTNNTPDNLEILPGPEHNAMNMHGELNPMYGIWDERNPLYGKNVIGENNPRYRHDIDDNELIFLRQKGLSYKAIADKVGCSKYTVMKRLGWERSVNHKVVSVESISIREDVYNGTVDGTNSYFVMCGDNDAILSANCGEQPLGPYESCNLGSINLSKFVKTLDLSDTSAVRSDLKIDWKHLKEVVRTAVRFLDNVIDANNYPIPEIETETKKFRKIGLGVMGWADMLIKLGISYNSPEALELAEKVMKFINDEATKYSEELLQEKGHGTWEGFLDPVVYAHDRTNPLFKRRNATLTTIAPTGTLSLIAGCSSGIEPVFSFEFKKKCLDGEIVVKHPLYEQWEKSVNYQLPYDHPSCFVEANDVPIEQHVRMQAAFQKHVHNAVSKTINAPNSATIEDVDRAFRLAYSLGCKGLTFYRDSSREFQAQTATKSELPKGQPKLGTVLDDFANFKKSDDLESHRTDAIKYLTTGINPVVSDDSPEGTLEPPEWMLGGRQMIKTGEGTLWVHLFEDPVTGYKEVWAQISKEGRTISSMNAGLGRLATLALNRGATWDEVVKQLRGIVGERTAWFNGEQVMSPPDGIAKVIKRRVIDSKEWPICQHSSEEERLICNQLVGGSSPSAGSKYQPQEEIDNIQDFGHKIAEEYLKKQSDLCPECATTLIHDEGCKGGRCAQCGWSNCS